MPSERRKPSARRFAGQSQFDESGTASVVACISKIVIALQRQPAGRIDRSQPLGKGNLIAGFDVSCGRFDRVIVAGVVLRRASANLTLERRSDIMSMEFPYVPGLLTFREGPAIISAFRSLKAVPDVVFVDGQGDARPRRIGLAARVGVRFGVPSVGGTKTRLYGTIDAASARPGASNRLLNHGEVIGTVVHAKTRANPQFISTGHMTDTAGAVQAGLSAVCGHGLPEPTGLAHEYVNKERRKRLR
jgi:deoxyribonuclease V